MTILSLIESVGLLHWMVAFLGILLFLCIRVQRVKKFTWQRWMYENLIPAIWSLFVLSLGVPMIYTYFPELSFYEALLMGYCGTHAVFVFTKPEKTHCRIKVKDPDIL
ncbi:MAG TPA: hypothetical protein VK826_08985 [Bacteroidia bacterium]|nr:hypothetical protein [Bacteroidia bacterium]